MRDPTDAPSKGNAATYTDPFFDTREAITARDSINTPSVEKLIGATISYQKIKV